MTLLPYDAVAFDLDGTLFDSEEGIFASVRYAMEKIGLPIPPEVDLHELIGPPLLDSFEHLMGVPASRLDEVMRYYHEHFNTRGMYLYRVYPHVRNMLRTLRENGVWVAMATSKPAYIAHNILRAYHMEGLFDCVSGENPGADKMGKPELVRRALPERFARRAMVGDRRYDMDGAAANGIDGIGACYGYGSEEELLSSGAARCVYSTEELSAFLCGDARPARGFFLSVEGPDGSGKSTQVEMLYQNLLKYGFDVRRSREPGGTPISEKIRAIILDRENAEMCDTCEALLYAASRAQHVHQVIRPAVEAGQLVLCDRFADSSVAYQGGARGLGVEKVRQINAPAVAEMTPDATVYLKIDAKTALARRYSASVPDRLEAESVSFHEGVQRGYEALLAAEPERFLVVDAARSPEEVAEDVLAKVLDRAAPNPPEEENLCSGL